jgi:hypothetical protein
LPAGLAVAHRQPYFHLVSWFPRPSSPRTAYRDFMTFVRHREREHVIGAALAVLITIIIVIEFLVDSKIGTAPPPQITYVELYPSNRTDAEIVADQKKDAADKEAAIKERQRQFQKLEKKFGM